jgi:hypothetical protein
MTDWKLLVLENDDGSKELGDFFEKIWADGVVRKQLAHGCFNRKETVTSELGKATEGLEGKILTIYGRGNYHHYTYGLCNSIAKARSNDYLYIHVDKHTDADYSKDKLDCASFTRNLLEEPEAKDLIFIGSDDDTGKNTSSDYTLFYQKDLLSDGPKDDIRKKLRERKQSDVYCSFDLDVLQKTDMYTRFFQGKIGVKDLLQIISVIQEEKNIISADMLGYCDLYIAYQNWATREVSFLTYAVLAAKITGKNTEELEKLHACFKEKNSSWTSMNLPLYNPQKKISKEFEKVIKSLRV